MFASRCSGLSCQTLHTPRCQAATRRMFVTFSFCYLSAGTGDTSATRLQCNDTTAVMSYGRLGNWLTSLYIEFSKLLFSSYDVCTTVKRLSPLRPLFLFNILWTNRLDTATLVPRCIVDNFPTLHREHLVLGSPH